MNSLIIATCVIACQVLVLSAQSANPTRNRDNVKVDIGGLLNILISNDENNGRQVQVNLLPRYVPEVRNDLKKEVLKRTTEPGEFPYNGTASDEAEERADVPAVECPAVNQVDALLLPHPTDVTMFYACDNGVAYKFACPDDLYFREELKVCDWKTNQ